MSLFTRLSGSDQPRPRHGWRSALIAGAASALVALIGVAAPAHATNVGTVSGVDTTGCKVSWTTSATNNTGLTASDPTYPGLMTNLAGQSVDYSNGGYISEVVPALGGPGLLEMQHWYTGNTAYFRVPLATTYAMNASTMKVTLPAGLNWTASISSYDYVTAPDSSVYPKFQSGIVTPTVSLADNIATVSYPAMAADSHALSVQFSASVGTASTAVNRVASATLSGYYTPTSSNPGCTIAPPPTKPSTGSCQISLAGQTVMPIDASDVTVRTKWGTGGEVNADAWGTQSTRTFRLYSASDQPLRNVVVSYTAAQGMTFIPGSFGAVITGSSTGMGALYGNGYVVAASGIQAPVMSADGKTVTLTIGLMPAHSAVAFTVGVLLDGSNQALVVNSTLVASLQNCSSCSTPPRHRR